MDTELKVWGIISSILGEHAKKVGFCVGSRPTGEDYSGWHQEGVFLAGTYIRYDNPPHMAIRFAWSYNQVRQAPHQPDHNWIDQHRPSVSE